MKIKSIVLIFFVLISNGVISNSLKSENISEQSFIGKWCGKWDQIYEFCLTIEGISEGAEAKYQWKEFVNAKFKKRYKTIKRLNRNTIEADNILLILDESNLKIAKAIGLFKVQTRSALASKVDSTETR